VRICRFILEGEPAWGAVEGDFVLPLPLSPLGAPGGMTLTQHGASLPLARVRLLPPTIPRKIIAVGLNYRPHILEMGLAVPAEPVIFLKAASSLAGPGEAIVIPAESEQVEHEGELAVVLGRRCRRVSREEASGCILGYTVGNDVTARDLQKRDGQWARAKSYDTFCPLGPWVETRLDPSDLELTVTVLRGGRSEVRQHARTSEMVFPPDLLVSFASSVMTLLPGDVILTGTPGGVGPLRAGDTVEAAVEGIGILSNPVENEG
jgi:2-keto-4-pentenoate hydratase/2-oxohepta-3-ene-1,7-dioic acid hydratase in catechol pathway